MQDATRERFGKTADRIAALQDARADELEAKVVRFVVPGGDERALDSGSGAGALAFALAPHVREVVAVDLVPELLEQGRKRGEQFPNVTFIEGDATALPFEPYSFDLAGSLRTLHHIARPELAVAELARVTPRRAGAGCRSDCAGRSGGRGGTERLRAGERPFTRAGAGRHRPAPLL
jgi:ubiquinone/menaquinone biosynthesis C-methylase UbiE